MDDLGHPERRFPVIHVAGTNGKGSVCAFLSSMLTAAGYKVGRYTSPHLIELNERIAIDSEPISDDDLRTLLEETENLSRHTDSTFFEFITGAAFLYFAQRNIDIAVVEVGLGGTHDATNVVSPEVAIVTNVSHDHAEFLGTDLKSIASEKSGIIKSGCLALTAETNPDVLAIIEKRCKEQNVPLTKIGDAQVATRSPTCQSFIHNDQVFSSTLVGDHQVRNALTALMAMVLLAQRGFPSTLSQRKQGIASAQWGGRLQWLTQRVLLDGAHNTAGCLALSDFLSKQEGDKTLVVGIKEHKDYQHMLEILLPHFSHIIITRASFDPQQPEKLLHASQEAIKDIDDAITCEIIDDPKKALSTATQKSSGLVIVAGSLYLVGDILQAAQSGTLQLLAKTPLIDTRDDRETL